MEGTALLIVLLGLAVGSFLNAVIYRLDQIDTLLTERSRCPRCKKKLSWWELIPILSYLLLRGKCYGCKKPISIQYPLVEITTALFFYLTYVYFGLTVHAAFLVFMGCLLLVTAFYDLNRLLVPYETLVPAIVVGASYWITRALLNTTTTRAAAGLDLLLTYGLGALVGAAALGALVLLGRRRWMGEGDVVVALAMGLFVGFPAIIGALFSAFVLGALASTFLIAFKSAKMKDAIPFAPFLVLGTFIALFWADPIIHWYVTLTF